MSKEDVGLDASGKCSKVDRYRRALTMTNNNEDSEDNGNNNELNDESSLIGTGLRRRKGKIISCAKETIENGEFAYCYPLLNIVSW